MSTHVKNQTELHAALNRQTANWSLLGVKLHHYHWYVSGAHFFTLHAKFEELYTEAATYVDDLAERLLAIGGKPASTMTQYLALSELKEAAGGESPKEMVAQLVKDFALVSEELKSAIAALWTRAWVSARLRSRRPEILSCTACIFASSADISTRCSSLTSDPQDRPDVELDHSKHSRPDGKTGDRHRLERRHRVRDRSRTGPEGGGGRHRGAQSSQVGATITLRNIVGEAEHRFLIRVGPLQGHVDHDAVHFSADRDHVLVQRCLQLRQMFNEGTDAAFVLEYVLTRVAMFVKALVCERDLDAGIEKRQFAQANQALNR